MPCYDAIKGAFLIIAIGAPFAAYGETWERSHADVTLGKSYYFYEEEKTDSWFFNDGSEGWILIHYSSEAECNMFGRGGCPSDGSLYKYSANCDERTIDVEWVRGLGEKFIVAPGENGSDLLINICGSKDHQSLEENLEKALRELNQSLPMRLDSATVLTSVRAYDSMIMYQYSMNTDAIIRLAAENDGVSVKQIKSALKSKFGSVQKGLDRWKYTYIDPLIRAQNCTNPDMRMFLDQGFEVIHDVYDQHEHFFHTVSVKTADCR